MRTSVLALAVASLTAASCAVLAKSPALNSPLQERLAKADTTTIEDAAKACLLKGGWKPDDVGGYAEGATVVSAKNADKQRISVYIQPPEMKPRVTGGPDYTDPFWKCLSQELGGGPKPPVAAPADSSSEP